MPSALSNYLGFLAETVTVVAAILIVLGFLMANKGRQKIKEGTIKVRSLNRFFESMHDAVDHAFMNKAERKADKKAKKTAEKAKAKAPVDSKSKVFVLDFNGDMMASGVESLRHEVSAVLSHAKQTDEVVVRLESPGGVVHGYGLAASQLVRLRDANIPLTICVDMVAASGGYMMACLGNKILSAPFAVVGSIGVVAQIPNFNRLLKKHDVDVELITAGDYKRTLTTIGENTEEGRKKFKQELEQVHEMFKGFVSQYRPELDIEAVATGESWYGIKALDNKLVDELCTSDDYLVKKAKNHGIYQVTFEQPKKKGLKARLFASTVEMADALIMRAWSRLQSYKGY